MFKSQGIARKETSTNIGPGTVINGDILCRDCIKIVGKVKGDVNAWHRCLLDSRKPMTRKR